MMQRSGGVFRTNMRGAGQSYRGGGRGRGGALQVQANDWGSDRFPIGGLGDDGSYFPGAFQRRVRGGGVSRSTALTRSQGVGGLRLRKDAFMMSDGPGSGVLQRGPRGGGGRGRGGLRGRGGIAVRGSGAAFQRRMGPASPFKRGGGGFNSRGGGGRGGFGMNSRGGGVRRGGAFRGRGRGGGPMRGGRGRGGRGGRGRGGIYGSSKSIEQMDMELDNYMGEDQAKGRLDTQLETYFGRSGADKAHSADGPGLEDVAMGAMGAAEV